MKFKYLIYAIMFLLVVNISFALDNLARVNYCEIAVSSLQFNPAHSNQRGDYFNHEDQIFKTWDENQNEGHFLTIQNTQNLGNTPIYNIFYHSSERDYFNEFGSNGQKSNIPIIDINEKDKSLYMRCYYKIGDQKIQIGSSSYELRSSLTSDFSLTNGIIPDQPTIRFCNSNPCSYYISGTPVLNVNFVPFWNNTVNNEFKSFFPQTEPYQIFYRSLNDYPTSLLDFGFYLLREVGASNLITQPPKVYIYINGSNIVDYLLPSYDKCSNFLVEDLTDGRSNVGTSRNFLIIPGNKYKVTNKFYNPYNIRLTDIKHKYNWQSYSSQVAGCGFGLGSKETDVDYFSIGYSDYITFDIEPRDFKEVSSEYILPTDESLCELLNSVRIYNKKGTYYITWPRIGSDNTPYLAFSGIRQELDLVGGQPSLNVLTFFNVPNTANTPTVKPGDFSIITRILYKNKTTGQQSIWREEETVLDLDKIKEITGGLSEIPNGANKYNFSMSIPADSSMKSGEYSADFFIKAKNGRFNEKTIAYLPGYAKFELGKIQYALDGSVFRFGVNSRSATMPITLFNPDFYPHRFTWEIKSISDTNNFQFSEDTHTIHSVDLKALETKTIDLRVDAIYSTWPEYYTTESFKIEVNTDQVNVDPAEIEYTLDISQAYWLNLKSEDISIITTDIVEGGSLDFNVFWKIEASGSTFDDLKNEQYDVKVTLFKDGIEEDAKIKTFTITENWATINFSSNLDVPRGSGDYKIRLDVDVNSNIIENNSVNNPKEEDNSREQSLDIKDPDESKELCMKSFGKSEQDIECSIGETNCWSTHTGSNHDVIEKNSETAGCCGDDIYNGDMYECWVDGINNSCCLSSSLGEVAYIDDPDSSLNYCNLMSKKENGNLVGNCGPQYTGKRYCWGGNIKSECCGDDNLEIWDYFTNTSLSDVLVDGTCYNGKWNPKNKKLYFDLSI